MLLSLNGKQKKKKKMEKHQVIPISLSCLLCNINGNSMAPRRIKLPLEWSSLVKDNYRHDAKQSIRRSLNKQKERAGWLKLTVIVIRWSLNKPSITDLHHIHGKVSKQL